jgi:glucose-6-phosphate dehydrogenase assembly protein OpcA
VVGAESGELALAWIEKKWMTRRSHSAERRRVGETQRTVELGWERAKWRALMAARVDLPNWRAQRRMRRWWGESRMADWRGSG